jgi:hypothetical protein
MELLIDMACFVALVFDRLFRARTVQ